MEETERVEPTSVPACVPPRYKELVEQWGAPIGVEEARNRWGRLVAAAEDGAITLVTMDTTQSLGYPTWAAIVPLDKVADPGRCPVWPLTSARPKLADVIADATQFPDGAPQIMTRHRRPVVAVVAALTLVDLRPDGERIEIDTFLRKGGTITLEHDYGHPGSTTPEGDLDQEPIPERYIARAKEPDGREIGQGEGDSVAEALLRLWRPPAHMYSTEPPFHDGWGNRPDTDPWPDDLRF
ncbi:type II toxin-antitoxin system Phd/YefM family antitoxin [Streptomyces sp. NRRL F-525]|uniref:type II toxin-antitoxin system Phd/YefM family antitoxin n=1 Tax=Streptomyces sp. NRRL F-525 TaxID=1463861 RepID=UPI00131E6918|nr:type II toxin-antitoxin system Phd/YefM family antitoxin [Streptomyces sp. NRRL F-525]